MTALAERNQLTFRRDRNITDFIASSALGTDVLYYSYVLEAGDETVLRVTNDFSLSQAFLGSFGGLTLGVVDEHGQPLLVLRREAGLTSPWVVHNPAGEVVAQSSHRAESVVDLVDASGALLLDVTREGNPLYPTYGCQANGAKVGVIEARFNGLSELLNKQTRYDVSFAGGEVSLLQRLLVVCAAVHIDVTFGGS